MSRRLKSPDNRRPRYLQVCGAVVAMIRSGEVEVGALLPTEIELCAQFGVSRHTVREALRRVESMGLIERRRGSGTRVKARVAPTAYSLSVDGLDGLLQYSGTTDLVIQQSRIDRVPEALADEFAVEALAKYPNLTGIRYQRDVDPPLAVAFVEIWVMAADAGQIRSLLKSEFAALRPDELLDFKALSGIRQSIWVEALQPPIADLLGARCQSPALVVARCYRDQQENPAVLTLSTHPEGRFHHRSELTPGQWSNG